MHSTRKNKIDGLGRCVRPFIRSSIIIQFSASWPVYQPKVVQEVVVEQELDVPTEEVVHGFSVVMVVTLKL